MKTWVKAASIRAVKTIAQSALAMLGGNVVGVLDVDWVAVASVAAMAGICSVLTSIAGLPEVEGAE